MGASSRGIVPLVLVLAACTSAEPDHHDMPEATAPIAQSLEEGPAGEGLGEIAAAVRLGSPASRASVWLSLAADDAPAPVIEVQAGWANGQTGPWRALEEVWAEGAERILAADLETAATSLSLRIAGDANAVRRLRWVANVPLSPELRNGRLAAEAPPVGSVLRERAAWDAELPRCGVPEDAARHVVLFAEPAPLDGDVHRHLRAGQAMAVEGMLWCDARASHAVHASGAYLLRGGRRSATAATDAENRGRVAVSVLGCEADAEAEASLFLLLDELTVRHGLDAASRFSVGPSPLCPAPAWLEDALARWLETATFSTEPIPEPETTGTIAGVVRSEGVPIEGAEVRCEGCGMVSSAADGTFTLASVEAGTHVLVVRKGGFVEATSSVVIVAEETVNVEIDLEPETTPDPGVSVIDHDFLIRHFGGTVVDPLQFPETQDGFQMYLDAVGVTYFAAWEYVIPNNATVAAGCGFTILLPERAWWPKAAALGLLADQLRALVNEPVTLRNWWRPPCYNEGVGGAPGGDHPDADALDLDFRSARSRADAQRYLCETYWSRDLVPPEDIAPGSGLDPRLNLSVGLGGVTIHLGLLSRNGRRFWKYASYTNEPSSGGCW